jgi:Fur family ferric uptake transcriptional regulator
MIAKNEIFATLLRENGCSLTKTRQRVFAALDLDEPITMHELVERCEDVDRASVYRSVALFEEIGVVRRLYNGWKYKIELSDRFGLHHHHATCSRCGNVIPLEEDTALESALRRLAARHSFRVTGHEIELKGLCSDCAKKVTLA